MFIPSALSRQTVQFSQRTGCECNEITSILHWRPDEGLTSPAANILPSGENANALTEPLFPSNVPTSFNTLPSQSYKCTFWSYCIPTSHIRAHYDIFKTITHLAANCHALPSRRSSRRTRRITRRKRCEFLVHSYGFDHVCFCDKDCPVFADCDCLRLRACRARCWAKCHRNVTTLWLL